MQARRSYESIVDAEFGLVRRIFETPQPRGEPRIFNYAAEMAATGEYLPLLCFTNIGGAGLTREQAYRAALGEAVERYCSSVLFGDDLILKTYEEMSRDGRAVRPGELSLFHPSQRASIKYSWFEQDTKLAWTRGRTVMKGEPVYVPASLAYAPYHPFRADEGEKTVAPGISTGLASGHSLDAALLGGIYEAIERDAFSIHWLNRIPAAKIDLSSDTELAAWYRAHFECEGLEFSLFDMTTDIAVPAVLAVIVDHRKTPPMVCVGGAAHSSALRAAQKALVEAAQTLQWAAYLGRRSEPFIISADYASIDEFEKHVYLYAYTDRLAAVDFLRNSRRTVALRSLPSVSYDSRANELTGVCGLLEAAGCEVIAVDLTSVDVAECGYYVTKAIVPQLQPLEGDHAHRFLGGPRLYDVPPKLGHSARRYDELNQDPHPYP